MITLSTGNCLLTSLLHFVLLVLQQISLEATSNTSSSTIIDQPGSGQAADAASTKNKVPSKKACVQGTAQASIAAVSPTQRKVPPPSKTSGIQGGAAAVVAAFATKILGGAIGSAPRVPPPSKKARVDGGAPSHYSSATTLALPAYAKRNRPQEFGDCKEDLEDDEFMMETASFEEFDEDL
jgi:hypothetical protein